MTDAVPLSSFEALKNPSLARLRVHAGTRSPHAVSPLLTGKFCEHLGSNIYNGMCAQILRNPTFADFAFAGGGTPPDGGVKFLCDEEAIERNIRRSAARIGWPEDAVAGLVESRADGLAVWWTREGPRESVRTSPDAGPHGGRAQRVEPGAAGEGGALSMRLPLYSVTQVRVPAEDS